MGASETQGTTYSGSWVPFLAVDRGLNFGPSQTYNKAIGGSTTTSLLSGGQHTQVASLVAANKVDLSYLFIGGLDVPPVAAQILLHTLNVPVWANGVVSRITTAIDTVMDQHPEGMIVASLPDMTLVPGAQAYGLPPEDLVPIVDAVNLVNTQLKAAVLARNLVFLDVAQAMRDFNAAPLVIGGVTINVTDGNPDPHYFFQDNLHPAVIGNGIFANLMLTALNLAYDQHITPFSDLALLQRAGLGGSYTGPTSNIDYGDYVFFNAVPEPSSVVLWGAGVVALYMVRRARQRSP